jgi:hypothetical protein
MAITTTQAAAFIPEIWASVALGKLPKYLALANTITRNADELGLGSFTQGNILSIPKRGTLTSSLQTTEGGNFTVQSPAASSVLVTLTQHRYVSFAVTDLALAEVYQDIIAGYMDDALRVLAEGIETDLQTAMAASGNFQYTATGSGNGSASGTLTEFDVLNARKAILAAGVNSRDDFFASISTTQGIYLRQQPNVLRFDATGEKDLIANAMIGNGNMPFPGSIGRVYDFNVIESQLTPLTSGGYSQNLFYTRDAMILASRPLPIPDPGMGALGAVVTDPQTKLSLRVFKAFLPTTGQVQIVMDMLYGYAMTRPEHAVVVTALAG